MRIVLRSQVRVHSAPNTPTPVSHGAERREWIEALFGEHLPRGAAARNRAIDALAGDGRVWRLLHQARHSMAETSATIERLARAALSTESAQAA